MRLGLQAVSQNLPSTQQNTNVQIWINLWIKTAMQNTLETKLWILNFTIVLDKPSTQLKCKQVQMRTAKHIEKLSRLAIHCREFRIAQLRCTCTHNHVELHSTLLWLEPKHSACSMACGATSQAKPHSTYHNLFYHRIGRQAGPPTAHTTIAQSKNATLWYLFSKLSWLLRYTFEYANALAPATN